MTNLALVFMNDKAHLHSILCCYGFHASSPPLEANLGSPDTTKRKVRDWNRDEHGHFVSFGVANVSKSI